MLGEPSSDLGQDTRFLAFVLRGQRSSTPQNACLNQQPSRRLRIGEGIAVFLVAPIEACKVRPDDDLE